jgi:hypothetical protein
MTTLLTITELAAESGYTAEQLRRFVARRQLPAIRATRTIRIERAAWEAFLARTRTVVATPAPAPAAPRRGPADTLPGADRY